MGIKIKEVAERLYTLEEVEDAFNTGYNTCSCHEGYGGKDISFEQWTKNLKL